MWIFLNNAMLSVVAHRTKRNHLLVRARFRGDLERAFPGVPVTIERTPDADYLYRVLLPRATVARVMADTVKAITYPNFKGSVDHSDTTRKRAYGLVWDVMFREQVKAEPRSGMGVR